MKNNFIKSRSSYGRIFGASILAIFMLVSAIFGLILTSSDTIEAAIENDFEYDFGDAPDDFSHHYNTLLASNGARHINDSGYFIGSLKDNESDGISSAANGDDINGIDDEDGVSWTPFYPQQGHTAKLIVTTTVPVDSPNGNLSAWMDFDRDGYWDDSEQILSDVSLGTEVSENPFTIPCSTEIGYIYLRCRFSTDGELSYDGWASDGEVEDYRVYIIADDEYPSQTIEFGGPKIIREWQWSEYFVVGPYTPVWINSSDACPGSEKIEYSVWVADDLEDPIVWTFLWNLTVYDNDENDLDETYGSIVTVFYNDETCLHEVRYQCWDYDGATEGFFTIDFFVDKCGPITTKVVGCPKYSYGWPYPPWISGITPLTFNSVDNCCLPNGTAVDKITIKVWWKADTCDSSGAFNLIDTIVVEDGDGNDINPEEGRIGYEFHFEQTGYYELEYWGVDMMGNVESHHKQQHRVDVDPPEITKTYPEDGYCEIDEHEGFIKCCSPINLSVEEMPDDTCYAGLYGMFWRYDWNDTYYPAEGEEGAVNGEDIVEDLCIVDFEIEGYWWYPYDEEIHFYEECEHDLRYFAIDNVGNYDEVHNQNYFVDNTPPIAIKEIGEPKCQNELPDGDWCITSQTPIWLNVTDDGTEPCIAGSIHLFYRIWYDGAWEGFDVFVSEGTLSEEIYLEGDCMHYLEFFVEDCVGNRWPAEGYHNETFYVDDTPPIIIKTVGDPNCWIPDTPNYCVNLSTLITLDTEEVGCCQNDSVTIEYKIWFDGEWTDWMPYEGPFSFDEECEHVLTVRAYDCLGNGMDDAFWHTETFYVDETPPEIIKCVGEPKCEVPGTDDWCVTTSTLITLKAENKGCCDYGDFTFKYRIWLEGEGWTGWEPYAGPFTFTEECMHYLEVLATDCLGNEALDNETFYVDDSAPVITKTVGEPKCDLPDSDDWCVTTDTLITLEAVDEDCCPNSSITIEYMISHPGAQWQTYTGPFSFDEECSHTLYVRAYDCLGNGMDDQYWDKETFYVDDSAPEIIKTVGEPKCDVPGTDDWCVTTDTLITLEAMDEDCCPNSDITIEYKIGDGSWQTYIEPFSFDEECEHILRVRAYDCLGNGMDDQYWDKETFYVDDSVPVLTKTVGEPKCEVPGTDDWCVTTGTLITLEAEDEDCCPDSDITIEYMIGDGSWETYVGPFSFAEECEHDLAVRAYDCLGNGMDEMYWHTETFYVDDSHPVITKTVGEPKCDIPGTPNWCVTTGTLITLEAENRGCCLNSDITIEYSINLGDWQTYTGPFSFAEECEHLLIVRAYDCLGNGMTEPYWDIETFYVDDSAPEITKTVGEPKCEVPDTDDWCVTTFTLITLEAEDEDCCPNSDITIEYKIEDGSWQTYTGPFSFAEECVHNLTVRAYDCLGNGMDEMYWDIETFYVDDSVPVITKTVGEPKCEVLGMVEDWCVTTSTLITLEAVDEGCCPNSSVTIEYMINWGGWQTYTGPFSFAEECEHILDVRAYDCLGNGMDDQYWDTEVFYVDDSAPEIFKTVGEPKCMVPGTDDWCVTTGTLITLDALDQDCCPNNDITIEYKIGDGSWQTYTVPFSFAEECEHILRVRAYDCLGNGMDDQYWDTETFYVDDTAPEIVKTVGDPNCFINEGEYCVTTDTIITIDVIDEDCCDDDITVFYSINGGTQIDISDLLPYDLTFDQECEHLLQIWAYDCLEHSDYDAELFYVDDTPPELIKEVGDPHFYLGLDDYGHDVWMIYPETDICFEAFNVGCCQDGEITIWYKYWYLGNWTDPMIYDGCINLEEGCVHYLVAWAVDCLGNAGEEDNETFWVCGPGGGDGDPNVEIIFPEHDSTQQTDYVEVILHAYDDDTVWEDLNVYLWIPGGRRDAPFLYYEVTPLPGEEDYYHAFVPIYWYQGGAQITLEALAMDEDGNTGFALPVTFRVDTTIVWDQWMQYGWNPLPLSGGMPPDFGCNESIESVMYSVEGSYDWVFHYDLDEGWISYFIDREINELTTIEGGKNYWVHIFNESGLRYYIGVGEIEILYPEDEALLFDLNEINGTTWNSETGMDEVHVQIYYKDENNTKHYWTGSAWGMTSTYLPCDLEVGYIQNWLYDSTGVAWIPGETFYVKARAMDMFGCYAYDMVSFEFESCICAPEIDLEKHIWDGGEWDKAHTLYLGDEALFNISISNIGEIIGSGDEYSTANETILEAIDKGLEYLASQQNADGSVVGTGSYKVAQTAFAVLKWAEHARRFLDKDPFDPTWEYADNTILGLHYLFNNSYSATITDQPAGDPDTNGNGIGVYFKNWYPGYTTGIVMQALEATNHPERIVDYGTHAGWTYEEVMEDCVDWLAWAQVDAKWGNYRGGWRYYGNDTSSDNSVAQWAALGFMAAENWGISAPEWVKTENLYWTNYTQNANGGFGYTGPSGLDVDMTGAGIIQLNYCGKTTSDSEVADAISWLADNWGDLNQPYAMFAVMKASMTARPSKITHYGTHDWGQEYDDYLISVQNADGSFPKDTHSGSVILGTEYALLVLQRIAPEVVSDCPPCNLSQWYINDTLPAGLGYVENSTRIIVVSCDGYYESSGPEVQPQNIISNPDGSTILEWWETGDEPFELSLCSEMFIEFNANLTDCGSPEGLNNTAYVEAYSPDDDSWVSDEDTATVLDECEVWV